MYRALLDLRAALAQAWACPSMEWVLNSYFQDFLGPLYGRIWCLWRIVAGKRGSFMSVIVHSVHTNIVPHIASPCCLF